MAGWRVKEKREGYKKKQEEKDTSAGEMKERR